MSGHMALVRKPGRERYLADRQVALRQQQTCPLDAAADHILVQRHARRVPEQGLEMRQAEARDLRQQAQ